jgi:hypothetical protein
MPIPVLLLNDFSKICSIGVTGVENTASQVGKGKVTYPLAGSRYYHKDATVDGLTKTLLEQYLNVPKENVATVNYSNSSLNNGGKETQGRVRIYFDKAAASIIGQIPE